MLKIDEGLIGPNLLAQLLSGDHITRVVQQNQKNLERLTGQPNAQAAPAQFACCGIHLKRSKCHANGLGQGQYGVTADGKSLHREVPSVDIIL